MRGIDLLALPLDRALNIVTALMVDDATPTLSVETKKGVEVYDRNRVRREVDAALDRASTEAPSRSVQAPTRARQARKKDWDPSTWGLLPEHQAAQQRAMTFAAGI